MLQFAGRKNSDPSMPVCVRRGCATMRRPWKRQTAAVAGKQAAALVREAAESCLSLIQEQLASVLSLLKCIFMELP
jgi:hypothetical protein